MATTGSVSTLWRLYTTRQGEAGKAEALLLLRTYWQQHKTDEDALRPLLELLGEQERYQEAEQYYQQLLLALSELELDEHGQPCEPDSRTHDIREYLCAKQIHRKQSWYPSTPQEREPLARLVSSIPHTRKIMADISLYRKNIRIALHLHRTTTAQELLQNVNDNRRDLAWLENQN